MNNIVYSSSDLEKLQDISQDIKDGFKEKLNRLVFFKIGTRTKTGILEGIRIDKYLYYVVRLNNKDIIYVPTSENIKLV